MMNQYLITWNFSLVNTLKSDFYNGTDFLSSIIRLIKMNIKTCLFLFQHNEYKVDYVILHNFFEKFKIIVLRSNKNIWVYKCYTIQFYFWFRVFPCQMSRKSISKGIVTSRDILLMEGKWYIFFLLPDIEALF